MDQHCCIPDCPSVVGTPNITFHKITERPSMKDRWAAILHDLIPDYTPNKNHRLCSLHFRSDDFRIRRRDIMLLPCAVPCIFNGVLRPELLENPPLRVTQDVIVIDDDESMSTDHSADEEPKETKPEIPEELPSPLTLDDLKQMIKDISSDKPVLTVDLESEEIKKSGPNCSYSYCTSGINATQVPTEFVRNYFHLPPGKHYKLCSECIQRAENFTTDMHARLLEKRSLLEADFPKPNEIVVIDESDDEEEDKSNATPEIDPDIHDRLAELMNNCGEQLISDFDIAFLVNDAIEKINKKIEEQDEAIDSLSEMVAQADRDRTAILTSLYSELGPAPPKELPPLDIPIDYSRESPYTQNMLKPVGVLKRPVPKVNNKYYAMKVSKFSEWIEATVVSVTSTEKGESYKVMLGSGRNTYYKDVPACMLAYYDPPDVRLTVGIRVIGLFQSVKSQGPNDPPPEHSSEGKFFAGIIAELPNRANNCRYLIFFEDGYCQYVKHEDTRLVCETKDAVHEYFPVPSRPFIKSYIETYPERPMLKAKIGDYIRVEKSAFWLKTQVIAVDASLIQVKFAPNSRTEWLYRGSPRLRPVYDKLQPYRKHDTVATVATARKRTTARFVSNSGPYIQFEILSSDEEDGASSRPVRAVARKSTTQQPVQIRDPETLRRRNPDSLQIDRVIPANMINPRTWYPHKCNKGCISWVGYSEAKATGQNPLIVPCLFGFRRETDGFVFYVAPCGRRLRNIVDVMHYISETKIPLTLDLFDFYNRTRIFNTLKVPEKSIVDKDFSRGAERVPIPCVNMVDFRTRPDIIMYMTQRHGSTGVNINSDPGFLVCCDCTDNCSDKSKCACWQMTINTCLEFEKHKPERKKKDSIGYQYQRLPSKNTVMSGIYECNPYCHCCKKTCINRVVQHPLKLKLQLFKTKKKGWGVRCLNDIPEGTFICNYVGNIYTEQFANELAKTQGDVYFAELDHIEVMERQKEDYENNAMEVEDDYNNEYGKRNGAGDDDDDRPEISFGVISDSDEEEPSKPSVRNLYGKDETVYIMDAKIGGNIGRYFNHSCKPNIYVQNVYVDTHDLRFPWVSFFSSTYIPAGSELTWNYGYTVNSVPGKKMYCYCEQDNCQGRLL